MPKSLHGRKIGFIGLGLMGKPMARHLHNAGAALTIHNRSRTVVDELATEDVHLEFKEDGIRAIARIAATVNERTDDIGARRLHTVMERLLDEVSFDAPDLGGTRLVVDEALVRERLGSLVEDEDLSRFIL